MPKSSLLFFHIGHRAPFGVAVEDSEGEVSGLPMCKTTGEGQRQFGPKISAIIGAHVAVAGSFPQGNSSVSSSGISATESSSMPIFGSGAEGISEPVIMVMPSRSSGRVEVGMGSWKSNGLCDSIGVGSEGFVSLANETARGLGER